MRIRIYRATSRGGFTLVEMLAVIGIMVILMAAAAPVFFSMAKTSAMRGAVSQVRSTLSLARQFAIANNELVYFIVADPQGSYTTNTIDKCMRSYAVYGIGADSRPNTADDRYLTEWESLPAGIVFDWFEPNVINPPPPETGGRNINLFAYDRKTETFPFPGRNSLDKYNVRFRYIKFSGDGRASWVDTGSASARAIVIAEGGATWDVSSPNPNAEDQYFIPPDAEKKAIVVAKRSGRIEIRDVP